MTMEFNATVELAVQPDPELADRVVDQLADFAAAASPTDRGRLAVTLTLAAASVQQAALLALSLAANLQLADPVALEILPTADFDRRLGLESLEEVLTVNEAAAQLGISRQAVLQRLDAGTLVGRKAGRSWHIPRGAVEAARTRQETGTRVRTGGGVAAVQEALARRNYPDPVPVHVAAAVVGKWGLVGPRTGAATVPLSWVARTLRRRGVSPYAAERDLPVYAAGGSAPPGNQAASVVS